MLKGFCVLVIYLSIGSGLREHIDGENQMEHYGEVLATERRGHSPELDSHLGGKTTIKKPGTKDWSNNNRQDKGRRVVDGGVEKGKHHQGSDEGGRASGQNHPPSSMMVGSHSEVVNNGIEMSSSPSKGVEEEEEEVAGGDRGFNTPVVTDDTALAINGQKSASHDGALVPIYADADWYGGHKSPHPELDLFFSSCQKYDDDCLFGGPVCASDNTTYANYMHMSCLNHWRKPCDRAHILREGPCPQSPGKNHCPFSVVWKPVCASDNNTYANIEAMECHNKKFNTKLRVVSEGECSKKDPCYFDEFCYDQPVCASNGRTYQSIQVLHCLRKIHNNLNVLHDGQCIYDDLVSVNATKCDFCKLARYALEPYPVCASDGKTYHNIHYLMCYKPELTVEFNTRCGSHFHKSCQIAERMDSNKESKPVCASDGHTYNSVHHIVCASFVNRHLTMRHEGRCTTKDSPCLRQELHGRGKPICGTDGVTYASFEAFSCIQRTKTKRDSLKYWHDGECLTNGHEGYLTL